MTWFVSVLVNGRNEPSPPYLNVGILPLQMPISFQFPLQVHMAVGNWIWLHIHLGIYADMYEHEKGEPFAQSSLIHSIITSHKTPYHYIH